MKQYLHILGHYGHFPIDFVRLFVNHACMLSKESLNQYFPFTLLYNCRWLAAYLPVHYI